jgi:hypothetical protein
MWFQGLTKSPVERDRSDETSIHGGEFVQYTEDYYLMFHAAK